jgi:hypothetical protein
MCSRYFSSYEAVLRIYHQPRITARILKQLLPNEVINVGIEKHCYDNYLWRDASLDTGVLNYYGGYIIEGDLQGNFFVEEVTE